MLSFHSLLTKIPCNCLARILNRQDCIGIYRLSRLEWSVAKRVDGLAIWMENQGMFSRSRLLSDHAIQEDAHARMLESYLESRNYPIDRMRREGGLLFFRSDRDGSKGYQYPTSIHSHPLVRLFLGRHPLGERDYKEQIIAYGYLERLSALVYIRLAELIDEKKAQYPELHSGRLGSIIRKIALDESSHSEYLHSIKWDELFQGKSEWSFAIPKYHIYWFILSILGIWLVSFWEILKSLREYLGVVILEDLID